MSGKLDTVGIRASAVLADCPHTDSPSASSDPPSPARQTASSARHSTASAASTISPVRLLRFPHDFLNLVQELERLADPLAG